MQSHPKEQIRIGHCPEDGLRLPAKLLKPIRHCPLGIADHKKQLDPALPQIAVIFFIQDPPALYGGADGSHHRTVRLAANHDGGCSVVILNLSLCHSHPFLSAFLQIKYHTIPDNASNRISVDLLPQLQVVSAENKKPPSGGIKKN